MTEPIHFWKMTGAGNDFIVLPAAPEAVTNDVAAFVRRVCRRGLDVGADGVLFVTRDEDSGVTPGVSPGVSLLHYNADGGRSDFCGNGTRCAARFAVARGMSQSPLKLRTDAGELTAEVDATRDWARIEAPKPGAARAVRCEVDGRAYEGWLLTAGVPHFVVMVDDPSAIDVARLGAALRRHPSLGPEGANIDFLGPLVDGRRAMRTFERGVEGETLACGSGALAAAVVVGKDGAGPALVIKPTSGVELTVEFDAAHARMRLGGEARIVFEGLLPPERGRDPVRS